MRKITWLWNLSLIETSSNWNSSLRETSSMKKSCKLMELVTSTDEFQLELVCWRDKFHKKTICQYSFQRVAFYKIVLKKILLSKKILLKHIVLHQYHHDTFFWACGYSCEWCWWLRLDLIHFIISWKKWGEDVDSFGCALRGRRAHFWGCDSYCWLVSIFRGSLS